MGHEAKWEYFREIYGRYRQAESQERQRIPDELCLTAGYHRKYAGSTEWLLVVAERMAAEKIQGVMRKTMP